MEPQEKIYCCINNKEGKNCRCIGLIIAILVGLFLATLGLILGAVFATTLLANIAVLILAAVLLALAIILLIIFKICICKRRRYMELSKRSKMD